MNTPNAETDTASNATPKAGNDIRHHLRYGWFSLLVFLTLGLVLETLHGFKLDIYLSVSNETRRLMWRLAHAHGTFLALVHIAFAATLSLAKTWTGKSRRKASLCITCSSVLIPLGFFGGGIIVHGGDPMLVILLVPIGAVILGIGVLITARNAPRAV